MADGTEWRGKSALVTLALFVRTRDMVDTLWTVFRVIHVDVPDAQQQVTTIAGEFDVGGGGLEILRQLPRY